MKHIYKEINKIRMINQAIQTKAITVSEIKSFFDEVQEYTFQENETGKELKDIFTKDLIEVGRNTANVYGEYSLAEDILDYALYVSENASIHTQIHEVLLTIQKNEENPFNDIKNIESLINDLENLINKFFLVELYYNYTVSFKRLEESIDDLVNDKVINRIADCSNLDSKVYFVKKILENINNPKKHRLTTDEFNKRFLNKLKVLIKDDEELLGRINERIYNIPFSTHGVINKVDKIKQKYFGKNKEHE